MTSVDVIGLLVRIDATRSERMEPFTSCVFYRFERASSKLTESQLYATKEVATKLLEALKS